MDLKSKVDFSGLKNEAERLVVIELEHQLEDRKEEGICTCEECILDMAAFALNIIKPHYSASLLGKMYAHVAEETDYAREVKKSVMVSIDRIKANPAHD